MRECLGWVTNCPDDKRCPQNWLEFAVTELPLTIDCHVCGQSVDAVTTEDAFDAAEGSEKLVAFPVVPPAGAPAIHGGRFAGNGAGGPLISQAPPPPNGGGVPGIAKAKTELPKIFYCVLASGEAIKIDKEQMIIGRSRTCDIVIPSAKVSRQHASLSRVEGELYIEDLGSANGVWRGGEKIANKARVNPGDVFTISEETLTFELR
jgi:hypothetical protein